MSNDLVRVSINGKWYEVEIGEITSAPFEVVVNGVSYLVQVETNPKTDRPIQQEPPPQGLTVAAKPSIHAPPISSPSGSKTAPATGGTGGKEIRAPMPGVILEIRVEAGSEVKSGQILCFLEAMKMKNAIRSPQAGRIAAVEVVEGQKVAYNDLLIRFE